METWVVPLGVTAVILIIGLLLGKKWHFVRFMSWVFGVIGAIAAEFSNLPWALPGIMLIGMLIGVYSVISQQKASDLAGGANKKRPW